jgi:hypothetical protein
MQTILRSSTMRTTSSSNRRHTDKSAGENPTVTKYGSSSTATKRTCAYGSRIGLLLPLLVALVIVMVYSSWLKLGQSQQQNNYQIDPLSKLDSDEKPSKVVARSRNNNAVTKSKKHRQHSSQSEPSAQGACRGYDGILRISQGDPWSGAGTMFFLHIVNQITYAEKHNLLPWVHLNSVSKYVYDPVVHERGGHKHGKVIKEMIELKIGSVTRTKRRVGKDKHGKNVYLKFHDEDLVLPGSPLLDDKHVRQKNVTIVGNGVWTSYFEPISPVTTERLRTDSSCASLPVVNLPEKVIFPGMHYFSPWVVRSWVYPPLAEDLKPNKHTTIHDWFQPQRQRASDIVKRYFRCSPWLAKAVEEANPNGHALVEHRGKETAPPICLAIHIRMTDKGHGRDIVKLKDFRPYAEAFVEAGGESIFLATDDVNVPNQIKQKWPSKVSSRIRMQSNVHRGTDKAVFEIAPAHAANTEALIDIYSMSKCSLIIHGQSAMTEASIYLNYPELHDHSVDLDDPDHMSVKDFAAVARSVLRDATKH